MEYTQRIQTVIRQVVDRLKADYRPERIILFGSWAYGEPSEESDLDLLIIKKTDYPFHRRWAEVYQLVNTLVKGIDFSPFVMTPEEIADRQRAHDPFVEEVLTRGKTLYAA